MHFKTYWSPVKYRTGVLYMYVHALFSMTCVKWKSTCSPHSQGTKKTNIRASSIYDLLCSLKIIVTDPPPPPPPKKKKKKKISYSTSVCNLGKLQSWESFPKKLPLPGLDVATSGVASVTGFGMLTTNLSCLVASLATAISSYLIYLFFHFLRSMTKWMNVNCKPWGMHRQCNFLSVSCTKPFKPPLL